MSAAMMEFRQADEALWSKWRALHTQHGLDPNGISLDGVVDIGKYRSAPIRILFIAKETNNFKGEDMRRLLSDPGGNVDRYGLGIGRWAYGLLNNFPPLDPASERNCALQALLQIASINLKKQTGESVANRKRLREHAQRDLPLLVEQIQLIDPQLIITCGTVEIMKEVMEVKPTAYEHFYWLTATGHPLLAFGHPQGKPKIKTYFELGNRISAARRAVPEFRI